MLGKRTTKIHGNVNTSRASWQIPPQVEVQSMQRPMFALPEAVSDSPEGQLRSHTAFPVPSATSSLFAPVVDFPFGHSVHAPPAAETLPTAQLLHTSTPMSSPAVRSALPELLPAAQFLQVPVPTSAYVPAGQCSQTWGVTLKLFRCTLCSEMATASSAILGVEMACCATLYRGICISPVPTLFLGLRVQD